MKKFALALSLAMLALIGIVGLGALFYFFGVPILTFMVVNWVFLGMVAALALAAFVAVLALAPLFHFAAKLYEKLDNFITGLISEYWSDKGFIHDHWKIMGLIAVVLPVALITGLTLSPVAIGGVMTVSAGLVYGATVLALGLLIHGAFTFYNYMDNKYSKSNVTTKINTQSRDSTNSDAENDTESEQEIMTNDSSSRINISQKKRGGGVSSNVYQRIGFLERLRNGVSSGLSQAKNAVVGAEDSSGNELLKKKT